MPNTAPSLDQLKKALFIAEQIQKLEAELASVLGNADGVKASANVKVATAPTAAKKKRTISPEARERIAAAQRARWAKSKSTTTSTTSAPKAKPAKTKKRTISPEARAKMVSAAKRRWAKKKA